MADPHQQDFKDIKLALWNIDIRAINRYPSRHCIETELPAFKLGIMGPCIAPHKRPHPGFELDQLERFGQIVIRTKIKSLDPVFDITARGQDQNGTFGSAMTQTFEYLEPVKLRKVQIKYHQAIFLGTQNVVSFLAIGDHIDRIARLSQGPCNSICQCGMIFDNKDSHCLRDFSLINLDRGNFCSAIFPAKAFKNKRYPRPGTICQ